MKKDLSVSAVVAGLIAVIVSYAGPLLIVFQAARAAHLSAAQLSSWVWAISLGAGVTGIYLSWRWRAPVITAWSTPGAALLVTSLPHFSYAQAVGAYLFSALLIAALAWSGWFERIIRIIPKAVAAAMLAGILFRFGTEVFVAASQQSALVLTMLLAYLCLRRVWPRYAIALVLLLGGVIAWLSGGIHAQGLHLELVRPSLTVPEFSWPALIGLGLPLALVTMTGQHVPGIAVMRSAGFQTPADAMVGVTSLGSVCMAFFGAHALNLAAITAAICTGPQAHAEPGKRYVAGITCGLFYIVIGMFGATLVGLFAALPKELVATIAGLALFGAIMNGLATAMADEPQRESALIAFLVTASNITWLGLGAAFWGLLAGVLAHQILTADWTRTVRPGAQAGSAAQTVDAAR